MAPTNVFDSLVAGLSPEERLDLLARVHNAGSVSEEPLVPAEELAAAAREPSRPGVGELGFLRRVLLFVRRLFTGKDLDVLLSEDELKGLARAVEQRFPGLVEYRRGLVLSPCLEELKQLRDSARFFYEALERSFDRDKAAFYAFLGSVNLPEINGRLAAETDPFLWLEAHPEADDQELRQAMLEAYDEIFLGLPEEGRRKMYLDVRCLFFLKRLSGFLFERLIVAFRAGLVEDGTLAASFAELKDLLIELGDILYSLSVPPSLELMEAIFVFVDREELGKAGAEPESIFHNRLVQTEQALGRIRAFNRKVPLVDLIRLVTEDPGHAPRELAAGEDWLVVYRNFWKGRMESGIDEVRKTRRYQKLREEMAAFVGQVPSTIFHHITRDEGKDWPPVAQALALSFVDAFGRGVFARDLNRPLKIVLMDGEFYRKDNRLEYTDAFDVLARCAETVARFDARLGPEGEVGQAWMAATRELTQVAMKRRKIQSITRGVEEEAEAILRDFAGALIVVIKVLRGILKGEAGGRYDSLSNLSFLDGRANQEFQRSLAASKDRCEKALALLSELSGLDFGSAGE